MNMHTYKYISLLTNHVFFVNNSARSSACFLYLESNAHALLVASETFAFFVAHLAIIFSALNKPL